MKNNFEKQITSEKQEQKPKISIAIIDDNKEIRESSGEYIEKFFHANVFFIFQLEKILSKINE